MDQVPDQYICPLSQCIMTDPVYDPQTNTRFERNWILRALDTKLENPCTRTPLEAKDLRPDTALQTEINTFISGIAEAQYSRNALR